MAIDLRQSTASQEIPLGYFVDATDGNTEETGLTIANTDIKLWKTGATTLADKNSGGATHIASGLYYCVLDATDTGTIGPMIVFVHVAGALAVRVECNVLDETVYDVKYGTTAPATVSNITGGTITTVTTVTNQLTAAAIATGVWQDATAGDFTTASSIGKALYIANIAPGAAGGHFISGSNSGTTTVGALTVTGATTLTGNVAMAAGLNITQSSSNTSALVVTGNGTGHGAIFTSGSGATGNGVQIVSAATNGSGLNLVSVGTGSGLTTDKITNSGTTTLTGAVSLGSTLGVTGTTTLAALTTTGTVTVNAFTCTNNFLVSGTTTYTGVVTCSAGLVNTYPAGAYYPSNVVDSGTAQSATSTTLVLRAAAAFADSELVGATVVIRSATTGAGQSRQITASVGATDTVTVAAWTTTPTGTIVYDIYGTSTSSAPTAAVVADAVWDEARTGHVTAGTFGQALQLQRDGTAQTGAASTITLDGAASSVDDFYKNGVIQIIGGTGSGQSNLIESYIGSTAVATVRTAWATVPDVTSVFVIHPAGLDLDHLDEDVSSRMPSAGGIGVTTFNADPLTLLIGFDHNYRNGNSVRYTNTLGTWPDMTDATVRLYLQGQGADNVVVGVVEVPIGVDQAIHFDVPNATTAVQVPAVNKRLYATVTLANGDIYPLVQGSLRWRDPMEPE